MKPTIIYISGSPGSGKSTLAKLLSEQLYIPVIASDLMHGGLEFTHPGHDRQAAISSVFVPTLLDAAKRGMSVIVDHVLQKDIAKQTIISRLEEYASVIYIHVQCSDPIARYISRIEKSELPTIIQRKKLLLERTTYHSENLIRTQRVIDLGVPTLIVDTNEGYAPSLDEIITFIHAHRSSIPTENV